VYGYLLCVTIALCCDTVKSGTDNKWSIGLFQICTYLFELNMILYYRPTSRRYINKCLRITFQNLTCVNTRCFKMPCWQKVILKVVQSWSKPVPYSTIFSNIFGADVKHTLLPHYSLYACSVYVCFCVVAFLRNRRKIRFLKAMQNLVI